MNLYLQTEKVKFDSSKVIFTDCWQLQLFVPKAAAGEFHYLSIITFDITDWHQPGKDIGNL